MQQETKIETNSLSSEKFKEILSLSSQSTEITAKTFFPERFSLPFAKKVHGEIFKLIDGDDNKVAIAAPRGWGKTSIVALALMARYILFKHVNFICYINKSHDAATLQTENLRRELVSNRMIKHFFGHLRTKNLGGDEFEESFSKKSWVAYNTLVWPRGAGQQIRGVLFKNERPGLIIIDDLEDPKMITNPEIRKSWYEWLYADVIKSVPRIHRNWKIVYIDTLKHEDSVLQKLLDSDEWKSIRLEACDDHFKSSAPDFMSDEDIKKEWEEHLKSGQTDVFFRELRNLPISTKDAAFPKEYFNYYNILNGQQIENSIELTEMDIQNSSKIETVIILDPAKTVKIHSDESAIVGIGIDLTNSRLYIREVISKKMYPDEIYSELFSMAIRLKAKVIGIEETSLNEFIKQPIKNEMFRRGEFFEIVWLKPRGGQNKSMRIRELVPYYRGGFVFHNSACADIKLLEQQLLMFPRSKLWDIMDATAYVIQMLEMGERYFSPQDEEADIEKELENLDNEESIGNWRYI